MPEILDRLGVLGGVRAAGHVVGRRLGKPVGYEEFLARVRAWQALLKCTSGQAFALYMSDAIEFASALYGAWASGKTIYLPGDTLPATCASLRQTVQGYLGEFASEWNPIVPAPQEEMVHTDGFDCLNDNFDGLVLFTSGSTGAPQAIPKNLFQLFREVATLEAQFGQLLGGSELIATVSHQHIYGLLFNVLWPLTAGRAIHARGYYFPQELMAALAERGGALVSSPAHLKRLPQDPAWTTTSNRLQAVFSSGGPLPFEVACEAARLLGTVPIEVYGSSETGGIGWRQQRSKMDEAWTPLPGVTCRVDPEEGVLEVRSPHLPSKDWFPTADRATLVGDHRFLITGRVDRIVKIEEKRISLSAIECQLRTSPMVADVRVVVLEGHRPRIAALVVPSLQGHSKLAEIGKLAFNRILRDTLSQFMEPVGIPRIWRYLDALPINAQGKVTRADLIAALESETPRPTMPLERLIERDAQRAVFEFTAPRDLVYFSDHFRDLPILAGVVQIDWVIAYGRQCFDLPSVFRGIRALKFRRIIPPERPFTLELIHKPSESSLSFKITSPVGTHTSGRLLFGASHV